MSRHGKTQRGAVKYSRENSVIISRGEFRRFYGFYGTTGITPDSSEFVPEVSYDVQIPISSWKCSRRVP